MTLPSKVVVFDTLRSLGFASISGTYANVGAAFTHSVRIIKITNTTDGAVTVSFDGGVTDHDLVPSGGFVLYDFTSNQEYDVGFFFPVGTQVAIKGTTTSGTVYLTVVYGKGE